MSQRFSSVEAFQGVTPPVQRVSPGLKRLLVRLGKFSEEKIELLEKQTSNRKLLTDLILEAEVDELSVYKQCADSLGVEFVGLSAHELASWSLENDVRSVVERRFALLHRCFPLRKVEGTIYVAMADPLDMDTIRELEFRTHSSIRVAFAAEVAILKAVHRCMGDPDRGSDLDAAFIEAENEPIENIELVIDDSTDDRALEGGHEAAPIIKIVNKVMAEAVRQGASDVHFVPTSTTLEVKYRVDGVMVSYMNVPKRLQPYVTTRLKVLAGMDIAERRRPQDGRFRMQINEQLSRDVRASVVPTPFGEKIVLRVLRGDLEGLTFESLGMPEQIRELFQDALKSTDQIVLVVGPTGSGKTTSLYAAINQVHDGKNTIVTVEDPVEFKIEGLTQIQVDTKIGITFASGLRSILRQDPDVILVGEIRDLETAEIAFQSAQTGHLVLSTLHTNDAPSTVTRLMDLGIEPYLISASLRGVLAQRLARKVCSSCAAPLAEEEAQQVAARYGIAPEKLCKGKGCDTCEQSGYRGRTGIYSFLSITAEIRELIRTKASVEEITRSAKSSGMKELAESALALVEAGVMTIDEAERVVGLELMNALKPKSKSALREKQSKAAAEAKEDSELKPRLSSSRTSGQSSEGSFAKLAKDAGEAAKPKVLVVDDDHGVRVVLAALLQKSGFDVVEAENGKEALELVGSTSPDLVVCDIMMPVMSGREFLQKLRAGEGGRKNVPVLMLTAIDTEEQEVNVLESGADDFVSKAASPAVIVTRVKRLSKRVQSAR